MFKKGGFDAVSDKVDTIVGKDTYFSGTINGKGALRIDGEVEGSVQDKGDVIIGESGRVAAELKARNITIAGSYEGSLEAEGKLELKKSATATGTFKANSLVIEEGAVLSGSMEMQKKEQADKGKVKEKPVQNKDLGYKPLSSDSPEKSTHSNTMADQ